MKESPEKVHSRIDADTETGDPPEPYAEVDECEGDLLDAVDIDKDDHGRVEGNVQAPMAPPQEGKTRKKRVRFGSHRRKDSQPAPEEE